MSGLLMTGQRSGGEWRRFLLPLLLLLAYRTAVSFFSPPVSAEVTHQFRAAEHLRRGEVAMDLTGKPDVYHPPLLTLLAAGLGYVMSMDGISRLVFWACGLGTAMLMALIVRRFFGGRAERWLWPVLMSLPAFNSVLLVSETHSLMLLLLAAELYCFLEILEGSGKWRWFLGAGAAGGAAYLARPEALLYFLLWGGWVLVSRSEEPAMRKMAAKWLLCVLVFLAPVAAEMHYIYRHTGEIALQAELVKNTFYVPSEGAAGASGAWRYSELPGAEHGFFYTVWRNKAAFAARVMTNIQALFYFLGGFKALPLFFFPLVGAGMFRARPENGRIHAMLGLALAPTLAYLVFHIEGRYLIPTVFFLLPWLCAGMAEAEERAVSFPWRWSLPSWLPMGRLVLAACLVFMAAVNWGHLWKYQKTAHTECRLAGEWLRQNAAAHSMLTASNEIIVLYSGLTATRDFSSRPPGYFAVALHDGQFQSLEKMLPESEREQFRAGENFPGWKYLAETSGRMGKVYVYQRLPGRAPDAVPEE